MKKSIILNSGSMDRAWQKQIELGLSEDLPQWDWCSLGIAGTEKVRARIRSKANGIWAGEGAVRACKILAPSLRIESDIKDGDEISKGQTLLVLEGQPGEIFALERVFLNLVAYVSGIATQTSCMVKAIQNVKLSQSPRLSATRKILPGYRDLAHYGVLSGGGFIHRLNLASGVLIKENHIAAAGSIRSAVEGVREVSPHGLRVEVEVKNEAEFLQAVECNVDAVLLDNFTPEQICGVLKNKPEIIVEVSGGINSENIGDYVIEGVDVISCGSITHSVKSLDFSLVVES